MFTKNTTNVYVLPKDGVDIVLSYLAENGSPNLFHKIEQGFGKSHLIFEIFPNKNQFLLVLIATNYIYVTVMRWELKNRLDNFIQRLVEYGHLIYFETVTRCIMNVHNFDKETSFEELFTSITIEELKFNLYIYGLIMLLSIIVFLIEFICSQK